MGLIGVQIAAIVFSIFMIYFTYLCYKRRYFEFVSFIIWMLIFVVLIIATLFPTILLPIQEALKISRLFDLFLIAGIFLLITITYINFLYIQKLKMKLEKLVQDRAMEGEKKA